MKKKFLYLLTFIMVATISVACHNRQNNGGNNEEDTHQKQDMLADTVLQLTFKETLFDFGKVPSDSLLLVHKFAYKNETKKSMAILHVASNCQCTYAKWDTKPIRPGDTGYVTVYFKNDKAPQRFDKALQVGTTTFAKPVTLRIRGGVYAIGN